MCLLAFAVVASASTSTDDHPSSARKRRSDVRLLDQDAILEQASLRTGKSAREILQQLSRLAERQGSPEAGHPHHHPRREPGEGGQDLVWLNECLLSIDCVAGGGQSHPRHMTNDDDGRAGGRGDLDRLLGLSGFPGKFGPGDHSSRGEEAEAILRFLVEVAHRGSDEAGRGSGDQPDSGGGPDGKASAVATSRRQFTRTLVNSCGTCIWYVEVNGTLTIEGPQDCGSTCTDTALSFNYTGITSIGVGAFNRTGISHVTTLFLHENEISSLEAGAFAGLGNLRGLSLGGNQISSVQNISSAGLGNLMGLILYKNQISSLEAGAFAGLGNLKFLSLDMNQISSLEAGAFAGLGNLTLLSLFQNQISSLGAGTFAGLGNLTFLSLFSNRISSMEAGTLAGLDNLASLLLDMNRISSMEAGTFAGLGNLRTLRLTINPLACKILLPQTLWFSAPPAPESWQVSKLPSNYFQLPDCSTVHLPMPGIILA
jgi:hypothetical protein